MTISVDQQAGNTADAATSVTVTITAPSSGDLIVCVHFTGDGNSTAPTGFSEAVAVTDSGNSDQGAIYWKSSDGTETSVAPGSDASEEHMAIVFVASSTIGWEASPVDGTGSNDATTETDTNSGTATTSADNCFVAVGITVRTDADTFSGWTNSFTESTASPQSSLAKTLGAAYRIVSASGSYDTTATHSNAVAMGMIAAFKENAPVVGGTGATLQYFTGTQS